MPPDSADGSQVRTAHAPSGEAVARSLRAQQMKEHDVGFDGISYLHHGYRYDSLSNAVAFAKLRHLRPPAGDPRGPGLERSFEPEQTPANEALVAALGITVVAGTCHFREFRYDRLQDAMNYARLILLREDVIAGRNPAPRGAP